MAFNIKRFETLAKSAIGKAISYGDDIAKLKTLCVGLDWDTVRGYSLSVIANAYATKAEGAIKLIAGGQRGIQLDNAHSKYNTAKTAHTAFVKSVCGPKSGKAKAELQPTRAMLQAAAVLWASVQGYESMGKLMDAAIAAVSMSKR